ncbi:MAG: hypothetical protein IPN07_02330 [Dehalococcoidia bacterium]|nr:hypothetical protein [Dehalococcoidia bacterium]
MIKSMKSPRRLAAVAVFAIVAMSAFGFAATNSVPDSHAGDGTGEVSGSPSPDIDWCSGLPTLPVTAVDSSSPHTRPASALAGGRAAVAAHYTLAAVGRTRVLHDRRDGSKTASSSGHRLGPFLNSAGQPAALAPPADTTPEVTL